MARLTNLIEQALSFKSRKGTSAQPPIEAPTAHVPHAPQKLLSDLVTFYPYYPCPASSNSGYCGFDS